MEPGGRPNCSQRCRWIMSATWRRSLSAWTGMRPMDRLLRAILRSSICAGTLRITTASGTTFTLGDGTGEPVAIRFRSHAAERGIILDPEMKFGEAYRDGSFVVEEVSIADVLAVLLRQQRDGRPPLFARP